MVTIGVAVAIPEPWAAQLQEYRTGLGDTTASLIPTHITLVPPTELQDDERAAVERHLEAVAARTEPFRVHLRGTGTFRPVSPVVFVTLVEGISSCERLAAALKQGPLEGDLRFPYHPHVTVAQDLEDSRLDRAFADLASFQCLFEVREFHLYVHDDELGWRPTREFPLASGAAATGGQP